MRTKTILACVIGFLVIPTLYINFSVQNTLGSQGLPVVDRDDVKKDNVKKYCRTPPGCPPSECCFEIRNSRLRAVIALAPRPRWILVEAVGEENESKEKTSNVPMGGSPLFELAGSKGGAPLNSFGCEVDAMRPLRGQPATLAIDTLLTCGRTMVVNFILRLPHETAHYMRAEVKLTARNAWPSSGFESLTLFTIPLKGFKMPRTNDQNSRGMVDGLPFTWGRFFAGIEHPLATFEYKPNDQSQVVALLNHIQRLPMPTHDKMWKYGLVIGVAPEIGQLGRAFREYIHTERPGRRTPMTHYNSWYDFYSYQDEGFNGGKFDKFHPDPEKISKLRKDKLKESTCLERVAAFTTELVEKRNTKIDSFMWDDGWDNTRSLWKFDRVRFPREFTKIASEAKAFGAGTGVWLSPWGGYGESQEKRVSYGKKHGYETNYNAALDNEAFSLAGEKYRKAFVDTVLWFRREQGVNMYKFDGVAGDPNEVADEMEAMLDLILEVRSTSVAKKQKQKQKEEEDDDDDDDDDVWINLTTGTWASPFFLLWADSIWRGASDIPVQRSAWLPINGLEDHLSKRQRWQRWRLFVVHELIVKQSHFFPISQLMIHGVIVANHGDALFQGLDVFDEVDFAQEVWSFVGLGLQLQELYVSPSLMNDQAWDILAEGLKWSRKEASVLLDTHWGFGEPKMLEVCSVASWDVQNKRGFIFFHNLQGIRQSTQVFSLAGALALPTAQQDLRLRISIVKSVAREAKWTENSRVSGLTTQTFLYGTNDEQRVKISEAGAKDQLTVEMWPSEVLVVEVTAL